MAGHQHKTYTLSRRAFFRGMRLAPVLFLPAPIRTWASHSGLSEPTGDRSPGFPFADLRLTPRYPAKSPLDDIFRLVVPGSDEFVTEKYAFEIMRFLDEWSESLKCAPPALEVLAQFLGDSLESTPLVPEQETARRSGGGIEVLRRRFAKDFVSGREQFLQQMKRYLAPLSRLETVELQITG